MGKIISLSDKLERWLEVFKSSEQSLSIDVSSNGRIKIWHSGSVVELSTVESVSAITHLSEAMQAILEGKNTFM